MASRRAAAAAAAAGAAAAAAAAGAAFYFFERRAEAHLVINPHARVLHGTLLHIMSKQRRRARGVVVECNARDG
jgi:hypothetical protein